MGPQVFAPGPKPSLVLSLPALGFDSSVFPGPPPLGIQPRPSRPQPVNLISEHNPSPPIASRLPMWSMVGPSYCGQPYHRPEALPFG
ncbi:hypothetical protein CesoFtcFv8_016346 [Champsocephalus esox]|uniref:Uncharacterized protein n=1 Tax=Champsocephalus esox TaxID=159716 RepID=A0AAN8BPN2_9TELE|nr:hypothetical protein CesoFtcFv8_016346 [Champsocephalus esox]